MGHTATCAHARAPAIRIVVATIVLKIAGAAIEGVAAYISGSVSLLGDTLHLIVDIAAGVVGVLYLWRGQRAASYQRQERLEIMGAIIIGLLMMLIATLLAARVWLKSLEHHVHTTPMLMAATLGLAINILNLVLLARHVGIRLMRMLLQHEAFDLVSSVFVVVSAGAIVVTGSTIFDVVGSVAIGLVLFSWGAWQTIALKPRGKL